jgi:hypothetical protein
MVTVVELNSVSANPFFISCNFCHWANGYYERMNVGGYVDDVG